MSNLFRTDAMLALPTLVQARTRTHAGACSCPLHARRRWGTAALAALAAPAAFAQESWPECQRSGYTKFASADQLEQAAGQQYQQLLQQAGAQSALGPADNSQVQRLRYIAQRIVPLTYNCNSRARNWRWEVNLIGSKQINAFCMPGGKIAFYSGILTQLQLSDDEVAMIMGHEVSHALLEHARERIGKSTATRGAIEIGAAIFGLGNLGRTAAGIGEQLLSLKFSRDDESEADALGLVLSANAGYEPHAGVTLWQKMLASNKGAPPQWMSTHPSGDSRIKDIEVRLARVQPMYERAAKPDRRYGPPQARPAS